METCVFNDVKRKCLYYCCCEGLTICLFCHFSSADNSVCLFDRRSLTSNGVGSPIHIFQHHKAAVLCVQVLSWFVLFHLLLLMQFSRWFTDCHKLSRFILQWSPDKSSVFGSCAEDGRLNIWDYEKVIFYCNENPRNLMQVIT